jgi:hypothetical protein
VASSHQAGMEVAVVSNTDMRQSHHSGGWDGD